MKRSEEVFPTTSLPTYNLSHDHTKTHNAVQQSSGAYGVIGATDISRRTFEVNGGMMPYVCSQGTGYTHWLSGGEFTIPYPGIEVAVVGEHADATIVGQITPPGSLTFYKHFYLETPVPDPLEDNENQYVDNRRNGIPKDTMIGDQGYMNYDGYSYGILSGGPAFMSANPFCRIEFFDLDDTVKLHAYNHIQYTAHGINETRANSVKNISNTRIRGTKIIDPQDPAETTDHYDINAGSAGNYVTYKSRKDNTTNLFVQLNDTGDLFAKTSSFILLKKGELPFLGGPVANFDPSKPSGDDLPEEEVSERLEFNFLGRPNMSQQGFFLAQSDLKYTRTFEKLSEELVESYRVDEPAIHMREDGSISIMSAGGSTIEMTAEGDIVLSPRRNLLVQAGGDAAIIAGNEAHITAGNNVGIHSTNQSVQVTGRERVQMFSRNQGIILETQSSEGIINNATQGNYFVNCQNYQQITQGVTTFNTNVWQTTSISNQTICRDYFVDAQEQVGFETKLTRFESQQSFQIQSQFYYWGGSSLVQNSSNNMVIRSGTPVLINHIHDETRDFFSTKRCQEGCRVASIATKPFNAFRINVRVPSLQTIEQEEFQEFELQQVDNETLEFYTAPWQPLATGGSIPGINNTVKGQNVFPTSYRLFTVTDNDNLQEINWSQFRLS